MKQQLGELPPDAIRKSVVLLCVFLGVLCHTSWFFKGMMHSTAYQLISGHAELLLANAISR